MRKLAMIAMLLSLVPMTAQAVTLGGVDWSGTGQVLVLSPVVPSGNQPQNIQCVICGDNQPQQSATFGYTNFQNQGNQTDLIYFSTNVSGGGNPGSNTVGIGYDGTFLRNYLLSVGDPTLTFNIGIDVNDNNTPQTLESFYMLNLTTHTVLASYVGPTPLPNINNGTGFPDWTLGTLSVVLGQDIHVGDQIIFFARMSNASDGPDSFFLTPIAAEVPLPPAVWLFGSGLLGLYAMSRRRIKRTPVAV